MLSDNEPAPEEAENNPLCREHRLITIFFLFFATGFYSWAAEFNVGSRLSCP